MNALGRPLPMEFMLKARFSGRQGPSSGASEPMRQGGSRALRLHPLQVHLGASQANKQESSGQRFKLSEVTFRQDHQERTR